MIAPSKEASLPHVAVEDFEGPFDVLLELAQAHKVDISRVSLQQITDDFLKYVAEHAIPTQQQLDFLLVTTTLLLLKVQRALPQLTPEEDEEVSELTDRLRIYQLYRQQAAHLVTHWQRQPLRQGPVRPLTAVYEDITVGNNDLAELVRSLAERQKKKRRPTGHLRTHRGKSLAQCLALLQERLRDIDSVTFEELTVASNAQTTAVSLLAVLELARQGEVEATQDNTFASIQITRQ
ncbi:hypothetical protein CMO91_04425 [Candidatus Woesearchaeota archaeon]|nr:hypothetical protein [Candidatus Woesearchaeota archaeon]